MPMLPILILEYVFTAFGQIFFSNYIVSIHFADTAAQEAWESELSKIGQAAGIWKGMAILSNSIDYEDERDDYNFIDEKTVLMENGKTISWYDLKRNGITWLVVTLVDKDGKKTCIVDAELA